jgi:hypothetical protein
MKYHAHKCETTGKWQVFYGITDAVILELPNWMPFSVVSEMMRGLDRTDPVNVYPELFNY